MNPRLKKSVLLFIAEFVVWVLAAIVIGAVRGDWKSLLSNSTFYIFAGVFSLLSAFLDYQKGGVGRGDGKK